MIGLKNTPKSIKRPKSTFSDKSIQLFVQITKVLWNRNYVCLNVETVRYSKRNLGKKVRLSSSSLQQTCHIFQLFSIFDNQVTILKSFRKFTSIRKPIGSGLKRVAAVSFSERYQTSLCAQFSKDIYLKT